MLFWKFDGPVLANIELSNIILDTVKFEFQVTKMNILSISIYYPYLHGLYQNVTCYLSEIQILMWHPVFLFA